MNGCEARSYSSRYTIEEVRAMIRNEIIHAREIYQADMGDLAEVKSEIVELQFFNDSIDVWIILVDKDGKDIFGHNYQIYEDSPRNMHKNLISDREKNPIYYEDWKF